MTSVLTVADCVLAAAMDCVRVLDELVMVCRLPCIGQAAVRVVVVLTTGLPL